MRLMAGLLVLASLVACDKKEDAEKEDGETSDTGSVNGAAGGGGRSGGGTDNGGDGTIQAIDTPLEKADPNGRKVLLVVANYGFYFKEYMDPRLELEAAGFTVEVAAGDLREATPHPSTGQRPEDGEGVIMPDMALADAVATDYDAIVVPGGWGASSYYHAYDGTIDSPMWAIQPAAAARLNDLFNEFATADKYIVGICNGVSVLAWSRVGGASLLSGKNATAPDGGAPAQTYKGTHYDDNGLIMGQFATDNGATLTPPYSIGDASNANEDVVVDGKVVTAQNQFSAQEAGRKLAELLLAE